MPSDAGTLEHLNYFTQNKSESWNLVCAQNALRAVRRNKRHELVAALAKMFLYEMQQSMKQADKRKLKMFN